MYPAFAHICPLPVIPKAIKGSRRWDENMLCFFTVADICSPVQSDIGSKHLKFADEALCPNPDLIPALKHDLLLQNNKLGTNLVQTVLFLVYFYSYHISQTSVKSTQIMPINPIRPHSTTPKLIFYISSVSLPSLMWKNYFSCSVTLVYVYSPGSCCDSLHPRPLWWILIHFMEASCNPALLREKWRAAWNFPHIPSSRHSCGVSLTHGNNGEERKGQ